MIVSNKRLNKCKNEGDYYENLFKEKIITNGFVYKKSTDKEDWYKHIDCYVNGYGVDVKGEKSINEIWIEYKNVNGNDGWVSGDAYYIAFFIIEFKKFCVFNRVDLLNYIKSLDKIFTTNKADFNKFYTREKWGKKDQIVRVKYDDIKELERIKL